MEDLIRRSDAIKAVIEWYGCKPNDIEAFEKIIEAIPSAESTGDLDNAIYEYVQDGLMSNPYDRPQGEWIKNDLGTVICSECKRPRRDNRVNHINFCNSCGARMRPELQGKHFDSIIIDESAMKGADDGEDIQSADE